MTNPLAQDLGGVVHANNGKLCRFAMHWEMDGDYIRCRKCKQPQLTSYADQEFRHTPACKAAGKVETHPWITYLRLLIPVADLLGVTRTHSAEIAGALAPDVRCGDWVLVPRLITSPATEYLAEFDMDSVGNNSGDAASECWAGLVDMLGREPPELKFSNPVFHAGTNLTVRRGTKWYREEWAVVMVEGVKVTVRLSCMTHKFSRLTDHWVRDEHDPSCRNVAGLLAEMQRVYPGFNEHEEVTLVRFDLPAAMQQDGGG